MSNRLAATLERLLDEIGGVADRLSLGSPLRNDCEDWCQQIRDALNPPFVPVEWRGVPSFPEYEVSSDGRVRRIAKPIRKAEVKLLPRAGYLFVYLRSTPDDRQRPVGVHRLVCEAFHGPKPSPLHEVAHWDGNRSNNQPDNLRWATRKENVADAIRHGTFLGRRGKLMEDCLEV